jgi:hypothetical protein
VDPRRSLHGGTRSFTLSPVNKAGVALISSMVTLIAATAAPAQVITLPPVTGPAQAALRQLRPPSPIEQVHEQAMRRSPPLPLPPPAAEQWVAERRVFAPELGREVIIPGHFERRVSDQQYTVPPLPAYDVGTGLSVGLPGGTRPPAELRQGP